MLGLAPLASLPFAAATDDADLRIVFAWGGTYVLTGQPIDLDADRKLHAGTGAYSLIGKDITLNEHPPTTGGTLLGFGPLASMPFAAANENAVVVGKTIDVETGVYILTGQDVDVDADRKLYPFAGVYTLTGQPVDLDADRQLHVETGVYILTGQDVDVDADRKLYPFAGVYILTGQDVDVDADRKLYPFTGSYALTGGVVHFNIGLPALTGTYVLNGQNVHVFATRKFYPDTGSYLLSGGDLILRFGHAYRVDAGIFTLTGKDVDLDADRWLYPQKGTYIYTGYAVDLDADRKLYPDTGVFVLTGMDIEFRFNLDFASNKMIRLIGEHHLQFEFEGIHVREIRLGGTPI